MMNKLVLVCSVGAGASLCFLYALFASIFLERLIPSTVTTVELVVVAVQFIKVAGMVGHYRTRPPRAEILLWLLSVETIVVLGIMVAYAATSNLFWSDLAGTVISTWVAGTALALPPYLIFVSVVQMMRSRNPMQLLLSPALAFGFLAFAASSLLASVNTFSFASFFQLLLNLGILDLSSGTIPGLSTLSLFIPSVVVFCSLFVRITVPTPTSATPSRVSFVLPLLGATVGLGWASEGVRVAPNTLLSFTVPGVIIVVVLYAYMRR
jgi:hypothetical protein